MKIIATLICLYLNAQLYAYEVDKNLYQRIDDDLESEYRIIGEKEAKNVLDQKKFTLTGGLNSVGLSYHRPFVDFSLHLDRNLAPDLMDDSRWIVTDTCTLQIDAQKVMQGFVSEKLLDLSTAELKAFAGLVFLRSYTWVHFAASYEEGLSTHFEKLFFPFHYLKINSLLEMQENEMIIREDSLSMALGAHVAVAVHPMIGVKAGALARLQKLSRLEVSALSQDRLQISMLKEKHLSEGLSIKLEALFFKALKMTLLSYDFEYEFSRGHKLYTEINKEQLVRDDIKTEYEKIFRGGAPESQVITPFIISEEKTIKEKKASAFHFLFFGRQKGMETQFLSIEKDGVLKTFFRHSFQYAKFTEHLVSGLFARLFGALTQMDVNPTKSASIQKNMQIEYQSEEDLLSLMKDYDLKKKEDLSLSFSTDFSIGKTSEKNKTKAIDLLEKYTGVDQQISGMIARDELKAPLSITGKFQVNKEGISYFNKLPLTVVFDSFHALCDERPKTLFSFFRALNDHCRNSLEEEYLKYYQDLRHDKINADMINQCWSKALRKVFFSAGKKRSFVKDCIAKESQKDESDLSLIPLWTLKNFSDRFILEASSKVHFYNLFGVTNVFFFGHVEAINADGSAFTSYFHEGSFSGFGSVDRYMRQQDLRSSETLIINQ